MSISVGMLGIRIGTKKITKEQLDEVIKQHGLWLKDHTQGKRAELNGYCFGSPIDSESFDFSGADLSEADLSESSFEKAKLVGIKLSGANLKGTNFDSVDMTDAMLDDAVFRDGSIVNSDMTRVHAERANFNNCCLWNNCWKEATLIDSQMVNAKLCDGNFEGADLSGCNMFLADIDYAHFDNANLSFANLRWTDNSYWASFRGADFKCAILDGCPINDDSSEGAKNLLIPMLCPSEGSFIGWKKCCDGRVMKIEVPEEALRTGGSPEGIRASEIIVLDIFDGDEACSEAVCLSDKEVIYHKGEVVRDTKKFDPSLLHDGEGIHFFLGRADAERFEYEPDGENDEDDEDGD